MFSSDNEIFFLRLVNKNRRSSWVVCKPINHTLSDIHSYPLNTEIKTVKTYSRSVGPVAPGMPPATVRRRLLHIRVKYLDDIIAIDHDAPRYFDDRVSYFTTEFTDFDADPQGVKDVSLITRWRLEPKPGDLDKS